jgi:sorbitol-specific phosphotransferase system component IIA
VAANINQLVVDIHNLPHIGILPCQSQAEKFCEWNGKKCGNIGSFGAAFIVAADSAVGNEAGDAPEMVIDGVGDDSVSNAGVDDAGVAADASKSGGSNPVAKNGTTTKVKGAKAGLSASASFPTVVTNSNSRGDLSVGAMGLLGGAVAALLMVGALAYARLDHSGYVEHAIDGRESTELDAAIAVDYHNFPDQATPATPLLAAM